MTSSSRVDVPKVLGASRDLGFSNKGSVAEPELFHADGQFYRNYDSVKDMAEDMLKVATERNHEGALQKLSEAGGPKQSSDAAEAVRRGEQHTLLKISDSELDSGVIDHIPSFTSTPGPFWSPDERLERSIGRYGQGAYVYRALEDGANPNLRDDQGVPMLHRAVAFEFDVHDLFEHGADLNATDLEGNTALHYAVAGNQVATVERLLEYGANPYIRDQRALMPAELVENEASEYLREHRPYELNPLLHHLDEKLDSDYESCSALLGSNPEQVTRELQQAFEDGWDLHIRDANGRTLTMAYADANQPSALEESIRLGADVNAQDRFGRTALMKAWKPEAVEILLKNGANPNQADLAQMTALHHCGYASSGDALRTVLLNHGANPNTQDKDGNTALHQLVLKRDFEWSMEKKGVYPAGSTENMDGSIRLLVEYGADPTIKNNEGKSAGEMYLAQDGKNPTTWAVIAEMSKRSLQESIPEAPPVKRSKSIRL